MEEKIRKILKENFGKLIIDKPTKELLDLFNVSDLLPSDYDIIQAANTSNKFPKVVHRTKEIEEVAITSFEYGAQWTKMQHWHNSNNR